MLRVTTATLPASPDRDNEDFVAASYNTVVLLDGAGNPAGSEQGCHHGVAWYTRALGTTLLNLATERTGHSLTNLLAEAIRQVADQHRDTCDLDHPGSPSATVLAVRQVGDELQHLVLADSVLVLHSSRETRVITDDRESEIGRHLRAPMDALPTGAPGHAREHRRYVEILRSYRNRPDGFWVASSDPAAARQAITGTTPTSDVELALLLSDGASRIADRFGLITWTDLVQLVISAGPAALLDRVREAERSDQDGRKWPRGKSTDDATAAFVVPLPD
jgi:serine/threonine protein phosphatase PrpC